MAEKRQRGYRWQQFCKRLTRELIAKENVAVCHLCGITCNPNGQQGVPDSLTWDHIIPRSIAPHLEMVADNLRPACALCNSMRGNKSVDECVGTPELLQLWHQQRSLKLSQRQLKQEQNAINGVGKLDRVKFRFKAGEDYPPYCPITGVKRREYGAVLPQYPMVDPDEFPYDSRTGRRRPGIEWPKGSGNWGW
ncbi:hypothetical protein GS506_12870 [Rhodococcus hoagii]|nr:hypothetical protein [Prescottella equi]